MSTEMMRVVNVEVGVPDLVTALEKKERQLRKVQDRLGRARASNRRLRAEIAAFKACFQATGQTIMGDPNLKQYFDKIVEKVAESMQQPETD